MPYACRCRRTGGMQAFGSASDVAFPNDGDNIRDPSGRLARLAGRGGQSSKSTPLSNLPRQSCRSSLPLLSLQRWPPLCLWRRLGLRLLPLFLRLALRAALGAALLLRTARSRIRFLLSPNILGNHAEADNSPADGHKAPGTTRQKDLVSEAAAESSQAQAPREPRHNYKNRPAHSVRLTHHRA